MGVRLDQSAFDCLCEVLRLPIAGDDDGDKRRLACVFAPPARSQPQRRERKARLVSEHRLELEVMLFAGPHPKRSAKPTHLRVLDLGEQPGDVVATDVHGRPADYSTMVEDSRRPLRTCRGRVPILVSRLLRPRRCCLEPGSRDRSPTTGPHRAARGPRRGIQSAPRFGGGPKEGTYSLTTETTSGRSTRWSAGASRMRALALLSARRCRGCCRTQRR